MKYSACIEWLFAETGDFPARIRAAHRAGLAGVEFWMWTNKDLDPIALHSTVPHSAISGGRGRASGCECEQGGGVQTCSKATPRPRGPL